MLCPKFLTLQLEPNLFRSYIELEIDMHTHLELTLNIALNSDHYEIIKYEYNLEKNISTVWVDFSMQTQAQALEAITDIYEIINSKPTAC